MSNKEVLHVYSSGAVAPPIKRCAEKFKARFGTEFKFTVGKAENLVSEIAELRKGDILTCGAEFILDEAQEKGLVHRDTRRSVGFRKSAILVPMGNPKKIKSMSDLTREGVKVGISVSGCLLGVWDDVSSKAGLTDRIRNNIADFADGCGAVMALINQKKVDAVFGWDAFKKLWMKTMEVVELPEELQVYRSTGVATIKFSKHKELAKKFIDFLVSENGKKIYMEYGWYHAVP
ncbi:MAG: substrate-binding domain-containing protein [Candidatus Bathyarchaeota archaeon]|nr:substrate-binding domain-containing protein [Candidatus Bathyarchaeota archaeon]MDH5745808.1 substrate-binding domain-containing protein [Candidatus Bathyarchaeota archaeon]